eukprot:ctg_1625.g371
MSTSSESFTSSSSLSNISYTCSLVLPALPNNRDTGVGATVSPAAGRGGATKLARCPRRGGDVAVVQLAVAGTTIAGRAGGGRFSARVAKARPELRAYRAYGVHLSDLFSAKAQSPSGFLAEQPLHRQRPPRRPQRFSGQADPQRCPLRNRSQRSTSHRDRTVRNAIRTRQGVRDRLAPVVVWLSGATLADTSDRLALRLATRSHRSGLIFVLWPSVSAEQDRHLRASIRLTHPALCAANLQPSRLVSDGGGNACDQRPSGLPLGSVDAYPARPKRHANALAVATLSAHPLATAASMRHLAHVHRGRGAPRACPSAPSPPPLAATIAGVGRCARPTRASHALLRRGRYRDQGHRPTAAIHCHRSRCPLPHRHAARRPPVAAAPARLARAHLPAVRLSAHGDARLSAVHLVATDTEHGGLGDGRVLHRGAATRSRPRQRRVRHRPGRAVDPQGRLRVRGKIAYAALAGKQFDVDPRSWRIMSDALEDVAGVLEIVTPIFSGSFLALASVATTMKAVAAMTGTATRHAIYKSVALAENQGDLATKGESQGVTTKLIGLGLGIALSKRIGQNYRALLGAYALTAAVHLAANYKAMKCIEFSTLNRQRMAMLAERYFHSTDVDERAVRPVSLEQAQLPTPREIGPQEQFMLPPWRNYRPEIVFGSSLRVPARPQSARAAAGGRHRARSAQGFLQRRALPARPRRRGRAPVHQPRVCALPQCRRQVWLEHQHLPAEPDGVPHPSLNREAAASRPPIATPIEALCAPATPQPIRVLVPLASSPASPPTVAHTTEACSQRPHSRRQSITPSWPSVATTAAALPQPFDCRRAPYAATATSRPSASAPPRNTARRVASRGRRTPTPSPVPAR